MDHESRESTLRVDSANRHFENDHVARAMQASFILSWQLILFGFVTFFGGEESI